MKQIRSCYAPLAIVVSLVPIQGLSQSGVLASVIAARGGISSEVRIPAPEDPNLPPELLDLMRKAQAFYLQGSDYLKSGEPARARECLDHAVDLLLQSKWDIASTPDLNNFFQDLIRKIKRDESLYLRATQPPEDKPEGAVLDELAKVDLIPIQVDPSLQDAVEADLLATRYDMPIVLNESVLKSLNYWLSRGKRIFTDGLVRSGRYREMIVDIFLAESIPTDLMYLAQVESLFKTNALSRAYARGMWQFTRGTAIRYGLKVNKYIDERMDPEKSTRAAAQYLKDLYGIFGDWNLALAAYNWGEAKIQRLLKNSKKKDFWGLTDLKVKRGLPRETRNHVPLVLSSIILARNPEKYDLPVILDPPLRCDRAKISMRTSLDRVAKTIGVDVEVLKRLNPALKTAYTPADDTDFALNIPSGTDPSLVDLLAYLPAAKAAPSKTLDGRHRVRPGESLWSIAVRYGTTVEALQEANDIQSPKSLQAGSLIEVPAINAKAVSPPVRPQTKGPQIAKAPQKR